MQFLLTWRTPWSAISLFTAILTRRQNLHWQKARRQAWLCILAEKNASSRYDPDAWQGPELPTVLPQARFATCVGNFCAAVRIAAGHSVCRPAGYKTVDADIITRIVE